MRIPIVLVSLCCLLTATPAAAAWTEISTPHYFFFGDASRRDMRRIAQRFEQFHTVMQTLLSQATLSVSAPTVVIVFANSRSFRPYMPEFEGERRDVAALTFLARDVNYIAMNAEGGEAAYPIAFASLGHLITSSVLQNAAAWHWAGLGEYYSAFELYNPKEVRLGLPINRHVLHLRDRFMPLKELVNADLTSEAFNDPRDSALFYAESWALVHFLRSNQNTRDRFTSYAALVQRGVPQEQAIAQGFGVDVATLDKALRTYVQQFSMRAERWVFTDPVTTAEVTSSDVDALAVAPHLAAILKRLKRTELAEQRLNAAIGVPGRSAVAHAVLAGVRLDQNRTTDAWALLSKDLAFDGFLDSYMTAGVLARYVQQVDAASEDGKRAVAAWRERIAAATAIRNDVPEAWRLTAEAHLVSNSVDQARTAIDRALALTPANDYYRFTLVNVLIRQREFEKARSTLGGLMAHGTTAEIRADARRMMGSVVKYEAAVAPTSPSAAAPRTTTPDTAAGTDRTPTPDAKRIMPVFRRTASGETRVFGTLSAIECDRAGVALVVHVGARVLRVKVKAFERIEFITYRDDLKGEVTCGPRSTPDAVYLTWLGPDTGAAEIVSETVAVEFTPRGYTPGVAREYWSSYRR